MKQRLRERGRRREEEVEEEKKTKTKTKTKNKTKNKTKTKNYNSSPSSSISRTRSELRSTPSLSSTYYHIRSSSHPNPPSDGFKRSTSLLHNLSFIFFVLLSLLIACACLYDIIRQTVSEVRTTAIELTTIAIGSCFLVLILSILIWISRYFTVKHSLSLIPRPYVPITQVDLPSPIYQAINQEYGRVAIISHLSSKSDRRPHQQRFGLEGWGKPGTVHAGKRFADEVLNDFKAMDRVLVDLLPHQPTLVIPTRRSSLEGPLNRYLEILSPSSPTQPTPILLTPAQKLLLKRYASVVTKAVTPPQVVTAADYELACKCLVILVDRINQCRSEDWVNPPGYGRKGDPIYEGVRFRDAIIETAIKLEQSLSQTLGIQAHNQSSKSNRPVITRSPSPSAQFPAVDGPSHGPAPTSSVNGMTRMNGKDAIESLIKKIFPLIYPPRLPSLFGPIIARYENILKDILVYHPHLERTVEEYEYSLRCIGSIISHVHPNLTNE